MPATQPSLLRRLRLDAVVATWRKMIERLCDPYCPERHYMRGPGPKWHARHRAGAAAL